jgi:hypothetical protein
MPRCRKVFSSFSPLRPSSVRTFYSTVNATSSGVNTASARAPLRSGSGFRRAVRYCRGIGLVGGPLDLVENVKQAVEANGRPPQGSPIIPHSQILQRASWVRAGTGHLPAPALFSGPRRRPGHHVCGDKKICNRKKSSRESKKILVLRHLHRLRPLSAKTPSWAGVSHN